MVAERASAPPSAHGRESRQRAGSEEPGAGFRQWSDDAPYPASSMPALIAGKCAGRQGREAFDRFHEAVFQAFSEECRDISSRQVLLELAAGVGLDVDGFTVELDAAAAEAEVLADLEEARREFDGWGIPLAIVGQRFPLLGAVPIDMYRRAVDLCLAGESA